MKAFIILIIYSTTLSVFDGTQHRVLGKLMSEKLKACRRRWSWAISRL